MPNEAEVREEVGWADIFNLSLSLSHRLSVKQVNMKKRLFPCVLCGDLSLSLSLVCSSGMRER